MPDHTDEPTAMAQDDGMYDVDESTPFRCYPDAEPEINPRVDEDGVAWCSEHCPLRFIGIANGTPLWCEDTGMRERCCPVAARRMARELAEARDLLRKWCEAGDGIILNPHQVHPDYIAAAEALRSAIADVWGE